MGLVRWFHLSAQYQAARRLAGAAAATSRTSGPPTPSRSQFPVFGRTVVLAGEAIDAVLHQLGRARKVHRAHVQHLHRQVQAVAAVVQRNDWYPSSQG